MFPDDPKDDGGKVPAMTYAWMIPVATRVARNLGYAIAVHGSMGRDLDLVAIPWVDGAVKPMELARALAKGLGGLVRGDLEVKSHGRLATVIVFQDAWHYIDLGIMSPQKEREYGDETILPFEG